MLSVSCCTIPHSYKLTIKIGFHAKLHQLSSYALKNHFEIWHFDFQYLSKNNYHRTKELIKMYNLNILLAVRVKIVFQIKSNSVLVQNY